MSDKKNIDLTMRDRRRTAGAMIIAAAMATLLVGCAGPQLSPDSASSPTSVQAPEAAPQVGSVSLSDETTGLITARLKQAGAPQTRADHHPAHSPAPKSESQNAMYTCPMHPEIKQPEPGECSICGMDLVPL